MADQPDPLATVRAALAHVDDIGPARGLVALRNAAPAIAALADECERLRATALCHSAARADLYTAYLAAKGDPTLREALRAFFKATEE